MNGSERQHARRVGGRRPAVADVFAIRPRTPRGFTMFEVVAAAAMLAVLLGAIGQLIVQSRRHATASERRQMTLTAIENAMEELTARDWDEVTDATIAGYEIPKLLRARWPEAKLTGSVAQQTEPVAAKRITLSLVPSPEHRGRPVTLTTWIYRRPRGEASP